jgi:N-acetylglutamate synthase-like GNAT family acetyltransferase
MRGAFRDLVGANPQLTARTPSGSFVESYEERLDDPQLDMFVAMIDQQPAGRCGLYQVGDIARVMDLVVRSDYENRGVENALTAHALAYAKRIGMRNICLQIDTHDAQRTWFEHAGFIENGQLVEFHRERAGIPT